MSNREKEDAHPPSNRRKGHHKSIQPRNWPKAQREPESDGLDEPNLFGTRNETRPTQRLIRSEAYFTSPVYLQQLQRANWAHVDPQIKEFTAHFCEWFRKRLIPIYPFNAFRTQAQQDSMFARGVSKARWPRAPHAQGKAVDLIHSDLFWKGMYKQDWQIFGEVGLTIATYYKIPMVWGGDETALQSPNKNERDRFRWDPAHWELATWRDDIRQIEAGTPLRKTPRALKRDLIGNTSDMTLPDVIKTHPPIKR